MKKLTLITISILTVIILSVSLINKPSTQLTQSASEQPQASETFTVTNVSNNEYYAELPDQSGVFFTQDDLNNVNQSSMQLTVGDKVTVSFEDDETITDIKKVN